MSSSGRIDSPVKMLSQRGSSKRSRKSSKKLHEFGGNIDRYGESDDFYRKWAGPVLLGPFLPAIFALIVIFSGQIVLNSYTGTCGYPLQCKYHSDNVDP